MATDGKRMDFRRREEGNMPNDVKEEAMKKPTLPLRVCCYGSSSNRTPDKYIDAAYQLGNTLAKRGHICVNGAGSSGCMAAMNRGADDGGGHIVGVIHEKFVETGSSGGEWEEGMHTVFHKGSTHELVFARGTDLQERKRLLVEGADAIVVLPGGPGTWDELWEMACARHIGFHSMPIVCINTDNYYDPFRVMLTRAHDDQLLYKHPEDIVHFEDTPEDAIQWIESYLSNHIEATTVYPWTKKEHAVKRKSTFKRMSMISSMFGGERESIDCVIGDERKGHSIWTRNSSLVAFTAGLTLGVIVTSSRMSHLTTSR